MEVKSQTNEPNSGIWAVVPVKDLETVKQRLSQILSASDRSELYQSMLKDVLIALSQTEGLAGVMVVTRDPEAATLARAIVGAEIVSEPTNQGHTAAVQRAAEALAARDAGGMLQIPGDLPLLAPTDIEALLAAHGKSPAFTIAPSRDYLGSNAVLCSPPDKFPLRFGDNSFYPHLASARKLGVEPTIVERPGFALDIDTADDLQAFVSQSSATRAYEFLDENGLIPTILD